MLKKELRKIYRQKRDALTASEKMKFDDLILIQFQTVDLPFIDRVLSFYPLDDRNEINTFSITDYLHFKNPSLEIAYPRTHIATSTMVAVACNADTAFEENEYNIPEPIGDSIVTADQLDLVLLPLLTFDEKGFRLGYGKGYYDRFLKDCRKDCLKIGLSYFDPVPAIEDANDFDVPLDLCITPHQVYVF